MVGRDYFGVFPLKGKLLNVREASHKQIMGAYKRHVFNKCMNFHSLTILHPNQSDPA